MNYLKETELITQFKNGCTKAFEELYKRHYVSTIRYGKSNFPKSEDDLKDAYQDIFMTLWKAKDKIVIQDTFDFYLKRSLKNYMIKVKVRESKHALLSNELENFEKYFIDEDNYLVYYLKIEHEHEKSKFLETKIKKLSKRQQFFIQERYFKQKTVEQIMTENNLAKQTVYNMINRGLTNIKIQSFK